MFENLVHGLTTLGNFQAILYLLGGSLVGVFLGVIPGLGGIVILSILLSFIYHISVTGTIVIFLGIYAASFYSASITSILLNMPAHPEAFAVTFDGFPMASRGEAGRALGISATATCIGGLIGCAVLVALLQVINYLPGIIHPPEFVALVLIALLLISTLGTDKVSKALVFCGIGIMLSSIGADPVTGQYRFTFNALGLSSGLSLVALALGLFAVPQMALIFGTATTIARQDMVGNVVEQSTAVKLEKGFGRQVFQGIGDALHHWVAMIRGALIGVVCGIIPGIGGFAANFLSYGVAQQMSKDRALFGTGIPEGILAPESSSLSKEAGGLVPVIGLGLAGGVGQALLLAALSIKGIIVGYGFTTKYPVLAYEMIWVIALAGIIGTVIGLLLSPVLARVTRVPGPLLVPFIMVLAALGPFASGLVFFVVVEGLCFTIIGFLLRRLRYSLAAFVIGLVLGPTLENNIFLTHEVFPGWSFLTRPLTDVLFAIAIGILILKTVQYRTDAKRANPPITEEDPAKRAAIEAKRFELQHPYPQLSLITSLVLFAVALSFTLYALFAYPWRSSLFPVVGGGLAVAGSAWRIPIDLQAYLKFLQLRRIRRAAVEPPTGRQIDPETGKRALPKITEKAWGWSGSYSRELFALAMYSVFTGALYVFGFLVSVPVFVGLYGLFATRRVLPKMQHRIIYATLAAAAMWGTTYEVFHLLFLSLNPVIKL